MLQLFEAGIIGLVILIGIFLIFLPILVTIIVGMIFAYKLGLTGISWWAFMIFFYIIISAILGYLAK